MIDRVVVAISIRTSIEADIRTLIVKFPPGHQAKEAFLSAILTLGVPVSLRRGTRAAAAIPTRTLGHPVPSQSWLHGRWGGGFVLRFCRPRQIPATTTEACCRGGRPCSPPCPWWSGPQPGPWSPSAANREVGLRPCMFWACIQAILAVRSDCPAQWIAE